MRECKVNRFNAYMRYRKFTADNIFDGRQWLGPGQVLVFNEQGGFLDLLPLAGAGEDVQSLAGTLCPGFVNTHCHLELSHMKDRIPPGTGMVDFLLAVMRQRFFPPETIAQAIAEAETEMLANGIVAVGDICNTTDTLPQKLKARLTYHHFIETIGFLDATAQQRFDQSKAVYDRFAAAFSPERCSIVPHAPYSVSPQLMQLVNTLPGNRLLSIHNQESRAETEFLEKGTGDFLRLYKALGLDISFYRGTGRRSPAAFLPALGNAEAMILVHDVETAEADLAVLDGYRPPLYFALCPNANQYIGNGLPDIGLLMQQDISITIGTDSLASNTQLNILEELKTIHRAYPQIPTATLLQWATLNGACALQQSDVFGSFEKGKTPGLVWLRNMDQHSIAPDASATIL